MRNRFEEVKLLAKFHNTTPFQHLQKYAEEFGELAQALNKLSGLKSWKAGDTEENIKANILEECADNIQIIFAIATCFGFTFDDLKQALKEKNKDYKKDIEKSRKI